MEPKGSLQHSQEPLPIPNTRQINPVHDPTSFFLNIHLNIILPSTPGSAKWTLSLKFSHQNPVYASPLPHTCYMSCLSRLSRFYHQKNIWRTVQICVSADIWWQQYFTVWVLISDDSSTLQSQCWYLMTAVLYSLIADIWWQQYFTVSVLISDDSSTLQSQCWYLMTALRYSLTGSYRLISLRKINFSLC